MVLTSIALSLTGSGHLLVYQLGACRVLLYASSLLKIQHVSGSSGGAIVGTLLAFNFDIDDYAHDFLRVGGQGLTLLHTRLQNNVPLNGPSLSICTTLCRTGKLFTFDFPPNHLSDDLRLMSAVDASCHIPASFHPVDIVSTTKTYPESEGILIDNDYYVDGGIAAPAPPPIDASQKDELKYMNNLKHVLISPITGTQQQNGIWRISPRSNGSFFSFTLDHNFRVNASFENLRALRASAGLTSASELQAWYQEGQDDANRFLEETFQ
jgi:hypothetical protein